MRRPRHHLQQAGITRHVRWNRLEIGPEPERFLELVPCQSRRVAVLVGRQVPRDERTERVAAAQVSRRVDHFGLPHERTSSRKEDSRRRRTSVTAQTITGAVYQIAAKTYEAAVLARQIERDRSDLEPALNLALAFIALG